MHSYSRFRSLSPRLLCPLSRLRCYSRYKLVYEKLVAEKQRKLLHHEQLLEEARRRSETRDEVAPSTDSPEPPSSFPDSAAATLKECAEALTARFVRDVSEGPIRSSLRAPRIGSDPAPPPLDLRKLVGDRRGRSR